MSNILVPINDIKNLQSFISAGAEEFYIGFYDDEWEKRFGKFSEINRMSGFEEKANPYSFEEVLEIIKEVKANKKSIFVTINSAAYSPKALVFLEQYLLKLSERQVDGVIVSTPEVARLAVKHGISPVASTMCGIYNSDIANYYFNIGVRRMILPRDISINEIEKIVKNLPNVKFEVFLMRNGCMFSDSHCLGFHRKERGSMCGMLFSSATFIHSKKANFKVKHNIELNNFLISHIYHKKAACGLCAIYKFLKLQIFSFKIVGRSEKPNGIEQDTLIVKKNIEIAKKCRSEEEYLEKMILPKDSFYTCKMGLNCYYPEVRFN